MLCKLEFFGSLPILNKHNKSTYNLVSAFIYIYLFLFLLISACKNIL